MKGDVVDCVENDGMCGCEWWDEDGGGGDWVGAASVFVSRRGGFRTTKRGTR